MDSTVDYREFPDNFEDFEDAREGDDEGYYQHTFLEEVQDDTLASVSAALRAYLNEYGT